MTSNNPFSLAVNEIKNRFPFGSVKKFKAQTEQNKSGSEILSSAISRYNCRTIPIAAILLILWTFFSLALEAFTTNGTAAELAGEILLLFTSVCALGFGFYFSGKYPSYYPYVFWGLYLISYGIKLCGCIDGAAGFAQTVLSIAVIALFPVFSPLVSALFIAAVPLWYTVLCAVNGILAYYIITAWIVALVCFYASLSSYAMFSVRMINSRRIKEDKLRIKMTSVIDNLTGLYDRGYAIENTEKLLSDKTKTAMIIVNIDDFSEYGRIYGSALSDEALKRVAKCVRIVAKHYTEIICRYQGNGIMVTLPFKNDEEAATLCEEIRKTISTMNIPFAESKHGKRITVTVSADTSKPSDTFDLLHQRVMRSQKAAKDFGGNCISYKEQVYRPDEEN